MRFAGERIIPSEEQNPEVLPSTDGLSYPQDRMPAGSFGPNGVDPTRLPLMRQQHMLSPHGGISFTAPFTPVKQYEEGFNTFTNDINPSTHAPEMHGLLSAASRIRFPNNRIVPSSR